MVLCYGCSAHKECEEDEQTIFIVLHNRKQAEECPYMKIYNTIIECGKSNEEATNIVYKLPNLLSKK